MLMIGSIADVGVEGNDVFNIMNGGLFLFRYLYWLMSRLKARVEYFTGWVFSF